MLVDLQWDVDAPHARLRREFVKDFRTDGGSLVLTLHMGGKDFGPTLYAGRLAPGVYQSRLFTDALTYTRWREADDWGEKQAEYDRLATLPDGPEQERLRLKILRRHNEFGYADTLADALRHGREFVRSPAPYALAVYWPERIDEKWHKNGSYVRAPRGRWCPAVGCVHFYFHKLEPCEVAGGRAGTPVGG